MRMRILNKIGVIGYAVWGLVRISFFLPYYGGYRSEVGLRAAGSKVNFRSVSRHEAAW